MREVSENRTLDAVSDAYAGFLRKVLGSGTQIGNRTKVTGYRFVGISTTINLSPFLMGSKEFDEMKSDLKANLDVETSKLPDDFSILAASSQRKLPIMSAIGELLGFLRGYDNAEDFASLGCNFWFKNANGTPEWIHNPNRKGDNDLGRIYGKQWTDWKCADGSSINQVKNLIDGINTDPLGRRHIINGWRPDELEQMALPPCHLLYQFFPNPNNGMMDLLMYQRSVDSYLGLPSNWVSCSLLLAIICRFTGYKPGKLVHTGGDCHIYANAYEQAIEISNRGTEKIYPPIVVLSNQIERYEGTDFPYERMLEICPGHFQIFNYFPGPALKAEMVE